jgi:hypothetical protein
MTESGLIGPVKVILTEKTPSSKSTIVSQESNPVAAYVVSENSFGSTNAQQAPN